MTTTADETERIAEEVRSTGDSDKPAITSTTSLTQLFAQKFALLKSHEDAAKALRGEIQALRDQMTGIATKRKNAKAEKKAAKHGRGARRKPAATAQDQTLPGTEPAPIT